MQWLFVLCLCIPYSDGATEFQDMFSLILQTDWHQGETMRLWGKKKKTFHTFKADLFKMQPDRVIHAGSKASYSHMLHTTCSNHVFPLLLSLSQFIVYINIFLSFLSAYKFCPPCYTAEYFRI